MSERLAGDLCSTGAQTAASRSRSSSSSTASLELAAVNFAFRLVSSNGGPSLCPAPSRELEPCSLSSQELSSPRRDNVHWRGQMPKSRHTCYFRPSHGQHRALFMLDLPPSDKRSGSLLGPDRTLGQTMAKMAAPTTDWHFTAACQ